MRARTSSVFDVFVAIVSLQEMITVTFVSLISFAFPVKFPDIHIPLIITLLFVQVDRISLVSNPPLDVIMTEILEVSLQIWAVQRVPELIGKISFHYADNTVNTHAF